MKKYALLSITAISTLVVTVADARAQEAFSPHFSGAILFEVENDWAYDSDDEDAEINSMYGTIEPYITLHLTEELALETSWVFEPVQDGDPGDDTYFDNEGLFAEEIKLTYTGENFGLFAGKYNPSFGMAWDAAPGIYGVDFAEDYELTERIGFGGSYSFGGEQTGTHTITANTFFADTTFYPIPPSPSAAIRMRMMAV